jgi:hypothetical protein
MSGFPSIAIPPTEQVDPNEQLMALGIPETLFRPSRLHLPYGRIKLDEEDDDLSEVPDHLDSASGDVKTNPWGGKAKAWMDCRPNMEANFKLWFQQQDLTDVADNFHSPTVTRRFNEEHPFYSIAERYGDPAEQILARAVEASIAEPEETSQCVDDAEGHYGEDEFALTAEEARTVRDAENLPAPNRVNVILSVKSRRS